MKTSPSAIEIEVGWVKLRDTLKTARIKDRQLPVLELDELAPAKLLKRPVDVNHGKTKAF